MITFKRITINNLNKIKHYLYLNKNIISDTSIGFIIMWNNILKISYTIIHDTLILRFLQGEGDVFLFPIGNNINLALDEIYIYAKEKNIPLRFYGLNKEELDYLLNYKKNNYTYYYDDRASDYIYSFDESLKFSGKKFKGQRNHINKFIKLYGEVKVKPITFKDINIIYDMLDNYALEHKNMNLLEKYEFIGTKKLIDNFINQNLIGAYIEYKDKVIAFSIGEVINDSLIIHVEKAITKYEGIYPFMYNSFIKFVNQTHSNIKYINREDDSGDIGIRTSKIQYQPIKKEIKYQISIKNNTVDTTSKINITNNHIYLSNIEENDKEEYFKLCTNQKINKYYGYNYKEDIYLDFPITSSSFYNSMVLDNLYGDSINLAIRLENKLIGEVILWHFTYNNDVEVGIRLFEEYQKNQIGKMAFSLLSDYAKNVLNLNPKAKCYKENIASYKMLLHSNYKLVSEDDEFYYFEY